jgi:hypothetical protein
VLIVFKLKLVIVGELLPSADPSVCKYDNPNVSLHLHLLSHAVRVAGVVDVASQAATERGIYHTILIHSEHVNPTVL